MKRCLLLALACLPLGASFAAPPASAPPPPCCLCNAVLVDGEIIHSCPCNNPYGGTSCTITTIGCRTNGVCTP